ncbi:MAG TPA: hypothetical protein EYP73_01895 [Acidimicrobiia bacterium]|nr:hypothetical protein [Acidimicrobiia bacterium]
MADAYAGPVRIYGEDGVLLTVGTVNLQADSEVKTWRGVLQVLRGSAVDGKALVVELETPDGDRGRAQIVPRAANGEYALSAVYGLGESPF